MSDTAQSRQEVSDTEYESFIISLDPESPHSGEGSRIAQPFMDEIDDLSKPGELNQQRTPKEYADRYHKASESSTANTYVASPVSGYCF